MLGLLLTIAPIVLALVYEPSSAKHGIPIVTAEGKTLIEDAADRAEASAASGKERTYDLSKYTASPRSTQVRLDEVNGRPMEVAAGSVAPDGGLKLHAGRDATIGGWALDVPNRTVATGIALYLDGEPIPTVYGYAREDVADLYEGLEFFRPAGWKAKLPGNLLTPGSHELTLAVVVPTNDQYYGQAPIVVDVS